MARAKGLKVTVRMPRARSQAQAIRQVIRQFPFAVAKALNDIAIEAQRVQREHNNEVFQIRKKGFWKRAVKIDNADRATPKKLTSEMHIDAPKRPDIFLRQQIGGNRKPTSGRSALAIPTEEIGRTASGVIQKREFPNRLKRDFVIDFADGGRGLFVRTGRRQKAFTEGVSHQTRSSSLQDDPNVRFLYALEEDAHIFPVLRFFQNATEVFLENMQPFYNKRLIESFKKLK